MGRHSSDSEVDRRKRRHRSRSRSRSHRKHKKSSRKYSKSRSKSRSRSQESSYSHHRRRSRSRSRSREKSKKHHKKHKRKHKRRSSSSESSRSERYSKSHSNRSSLDRSRSNREHRSSRARSKSKDIVDPNVSTLLEESVSLTDMTSTQLLAHDRLLSDIETSSFVQQSFTSSRSTKTPAAVDNDKDKGFEFGTNAELKSKKGTMENLKDDILYSPFLFGDPEEREERYLKRMFLMRQRVALGEAV